MTPPSSAPTNDPPITGGATGCKSIDPGPSPMRRLSNSEYVNTVKDLFGGQLPADLSFIAEARVDGFDNNADGRTVSNTLALQYYTAAEKLAAAATANLPALLPCDPGARGEAACLDQFLDSFGKRAWRRPLEAAERDGLKKTFAQGKETSFADGIASVIQVMLLSPQFMYRVERGSAVPSAGYLRLTGFELASRLSYLLWGSMPDDKLLAAAEGGSLRTGEDVLAQARRMLEDPRAARTVARFTDQWLRHEEIAALEKEEMVYTTFKPELRAALYGEVRALLDDVIWKGDGKLGTLLTAPYTFMNGPLAAFYGEKGVTGETFQKVMFDPKQRSGFLAQGGFLGVLGVNDGGLTSLVYRGVFVRERLFCTHVPDPPPDAPDMQPLFDPATTSARKWSEDRQKIALCGACHAAFDPIGLGFENFDGVGLYRTQDHGQPVDASGELIGTDVDGRFTGVPELTRKLAASRDVRACMATQLFRYGHGREATDSDACTLDRLKSVSNTSGGSLEGPAARPHPDRRLPSSRQRRPAMISSKPPGKPGKLPLSRRALLRGAWRHRPRAALPGRDDPAQGQRRDGGAPAAADLLHRERRGAVHLVSERQREGLDDAGEPGAASAVPEEPDRVRGA